MSKPEGKTAPVREHPPELLEFARRAAERGMIVQLPALNAELPDPVDLGGVSLSEMVVRLRRCGP
jgi:hypothetical protein